MVGSRGKEMTHRIPRSEFSHAGSFRTALFTGAQRPSRTVDIRDADSTTDDGGNLPPVPAPQQPDRFADARELNGVLGWVMFAPASSFDGGLYNTGVGDNGQFTSGGW